MPEYYVLDQADLMTFRDIARRVKSGRGSGRQGDRRRRGPVQDQAQTLRVALGQCSGAVSSSDEQFILDELHAVVGALPTENNVDGEPVPVETIIVNNWFRWDLSDNARVLAVQGLDWIGDDASRWLAVQAECS